MSKRKVKYRDPGARVEQELYDPDLPRGGYRYVVVLSCGRRLPWGGSMAQAWKHAEMRLDREETTPLAVKAGLCEPQIYA